MDFAQQDDGDLQITDNDFPLVTGAAEVRQRIIQRLRTFLGEWFLDFTIGVPYFQEILKKVPNPEAVEAVLQAEIVNTLGVIELQEFSLDIDNTRNLTVSFVVRAFDGELIEVSEVLGL